MASGLVEIDKPVDASAIKGDEIRIQTILSRGVHGKSATVKEFAGITVTVKTQPEVEDFMRTLGNGELIDVGTVGRYWIPFSDRPLMAYVTQPLAPEASYDVPTASLDRLGQPLSVGGEAVMNGNGRPSGQSMPETINLSFLRLVGISQGAGVTFGIKGVYTESGLMNLRNKIAKEQVRFYREYLRPIDLMITVSTSQIKL